MAVIYLSHPVHGAKVAISEHEAAQDEMFGWTRFDPVAPANDDDEDDAPVNEMAAPKRRGRRRTAQDD